MIRTDQIHVAMTKMSEPVLVLPCQSNALIGTLKKIQVITMLLNFILKYGNI